MTEWSARVDDEGADELTGPELRVGCNARDGSLKRVGAALWSNSTTSSGQSRATLESEAATLGS